MITMILLDTNIFVIDRFFKRDNNYADNQDFLQKLPQLDAGFSIFSLQELCGISSFNLSEAELQRWIVSFTKIYDVKILSPYGMSKNIDAETWFGDHIADIFKLFKRKMTVGDALVVQAAEQYQVESIITWNIKHFVDRTDIPVYTPREFLDKQP